MGTRELAAALGIDKALVSRLTKRGMPMNSVEAANAWRAVHAPPRRRRRVQQAFNTALAMQHGPGVPDLWHSRAQPGGFP